MINTGLLLLRLMVGILVAVHGTQKLSHRLEAVGSKQPSASSRTTAFAAVG
jgi:uncharacterized membrane protein YphA (DoxX/SURF4 family)